jgi:putative hemolysin
MMTRTAQRPADRARLAVTFAEDRAGILEAQRLRYRVFAGELGARLATADRGIDEDEFDRHCEHLVVRDLSTGRTVGTYRVLSPDAARRAGGYYSEREFDLARLGALRGRMVEVGRACVDADYRSSFVMLLMWSALARYALDNGYEHLVGSASVAMADGGHNAASVYRAVAAERMSPDTLRVFPREPLPLERFEPGEPSGMPPLLRGYLGMGAWVCGEPAWDRDFNCADLPILLSLDRLDARFARHFMRKAA